MNELWQLFITFAKIGVMTFGGGAAMLPMLQRELVDNRGWVEEEELMDYYAIGQCTPGIIAVNTATFIGHRTRGIIGGIAATLGVVFPSLVIITIIAAFISNFAELSLVANAFAGIRVCVCVLVINAVIKLYKSAVVDKIAFLIFLVVAVLMLLTDISAVVFVLAAGVLGVVIKTLGTLLKNAGGDKK